MPRANIIGLLLRSAILTKVPTSMVHQSHARKVTCHSQNLHRAPVRVILREARPPNVPPLFCISTIERHPPIPPIYFIPVYFKLLLMLPSTSAGRIMHRHTALARTLSTKIFFFFYTCAIFELIFLGIFFYLPASDIFLFYFTFEIGSVKNLSQRRSRKRSVDVARIDFKPIFTNRELIQSGIKKEHDFKTISRKIP